MILFYILVGWVLTSLAASYVLWDQYIVIMGLKRVRDAGKLTPAMRVLGTPRLVFGFALDVYVNVAVITAILGELPKEWTVSERLTRHFEHSKGWRFAFSAWVLSEMLDAFDPAGVHRA
jgi:hypothetical protein